MLFKKKKTLKIFQFSFILKDNKHPNSEKVVGGKLFRSFKRVTNGFWEFPIISLQLMFYPHYIAEIYRGNILRTHQDSKSLNLQKQPSLMQARIEPSSSAL